MPEWSVVEIMDPACFNRSSVDAAGCPKGFPAPASMIPDEGFRREIPCLEKIHFHDYPSDVKHRQQRNPCGTGPETTGPRPFSLSLRSGVPGGSPGRSRNWWTRCRLWKKSRFVHQTGPLRRRWTTGDRNPPSVPPFPFILSRAAEHAGGHRGVKTGTWRRSYPAPSGDLRQGGFLSPPLACRRKTSNRSR